MERQRRESRQSSLPSSLIPHLYTGPQESADSSNTTLFRATLPLPTPAVINEGGSTDCVSSLTLPPLAPSFSAASTRDEASHGPRYSSYGSISPVPGEHILNTRTSSPTEKPDSATISRSLASLSIPTHRQRYASPRYSDPFYPTPRPQSFSHEPSSAYSLPIPALPRGCWREGEAGPSSLIYPARHEQGRSRGSSQPAERTLQLDAFRIGGSNNGRESHLKSDYDREVGGRRERAIPLEIPYGARSEPFHATSGQVSSLGAGRLSPHLPGAYTLSTVGTQRPTWSGTIPSGGGVGLIDLPTAYSPSPMSEMSGELQPDEEIGDDVSTAQKGKKRGREGEGEDSSKKSQNTRKTAVACNFCRGRKLRCNGAKPSCYNCTVRKFQCEYVPVQRRRGPGKAPKGTKTKKGPNARSRSETSTTLPPIDHPSSESLPRTSTISARGLEFGSASPSPGYAVLSNSSTCRPTSSPEPETGY